MITRFEGPGRTLKPVLLSGSGVQLMRNKFTIDPGGDPEHEDLVVEIYCGERPEDDFVALVSQDRGPTLLEIEIHPRKDGQPWIFDLCEFEDALKRARQRLWELRRTESTTPDSDA